MQWLPTGQQAIGAALQRAALPPKLVLKLVYPSQPTGSSINPWTQFPYTAIGTGALGAAAGAVTDFGYALSELAAAETSTETLAATMSLGGALLEGGALGGTLGLGVGAIAGVAIAGGIYAYETYFITTDHLMTQEGWCSSGDDRSIKGAGFPGRM